MPEWTNEQKRALESGGKLTVVSAAAGSGKTTVLVTKAVNIILDENNRTDADRLLIVTFSNASAAEFKDRIEKRLNERMRNDPSNAYIRAQKMRFQKRDVSTIHSFCIKLVRENFQDLDLTPDFMIADEAQADALHERAISEAMDRGYDSKDFNDLVSFSGRSSDDRPVRDFLRKMDTYFSALPDPEGRIVSMLNDYADPKGLKNSRSFNWLLDYTKDVLDYMQSLCSRMDEIYSLGAFTGYDRGLTAIRSAVSGLTASIYVSDFPARISALSRGLPKLGSARPSCAESEAVKTVRELLSKSWDELSEIVVFFDEDRFSKDMSASLPYARALVDVYLDYQHTLKDLKLEKRQFEFADFEHFAYRLLVSESGEYTPLCLELRDRYEYIMEDEFQDTSYIQDAIFNRISKEGQSNLFVVGDIKQSIYSFRKASPEIFKAKRQLGIDDPDQAETIFLKHNFRSEESVLNGVNYLFSRLMSEKCGGVDYDENEELRTLKEPDGSVGIRFNLYDDDEIDRNISMISTMIHDGELIKDGDGTRPVRPGDFCILMRSSRKMASYKEKLEELGFEVYVKDDEPIIRKPEIECVINLLRVINNPTKELYLSRTMFGDMFDFDLDEILKIRFGEDLPSRENANINLFTALKRRGTEKAESFLNVLHELMSSARILSIDKLIDHVCKRTGHYRRLSFSADGNEKRENLRWFIDFAKSWRKTHSGDLSAFLRSVDLYLAKERNTSRNNSKKADDAIAIMTIHASKGLEFPVVIVADLDKRMNRQDVSSRLLFDTDLGIGMYVNTGFGYNESTINVKAIQKKTSVNLSSEEMRLYYVAFTRAKSLLILTSKKPSGAAFRRASGVAGESIHRQYLSGIETASEWLIAALSGDSTVRSLSESTFEAFRPTPASIFVEYIDHTGETYPNTYTRDVRESMVNADMDRINSYLSFEYPDLVRTKLPTKVSVSEIAKARDTQLAVPLFARPDADSANAAEKGTAMHRMAQYIDIHKARGDLDGRLKDLADMGIIDLDLIDRKLADNFVNSRLADDMLICDRIFREQSFLVPYPANDAFGNPEYAGYDVLVQGVMDCVLQYGDSITIVDYKTDRVKSMEELKDRYSRQLELYRHAAKLLYGMDKVRCVIYSFRLNDTIDIR